METSLHNTHFQDPTINSGVGLSLYGRQFNFQTPYNETQNLTVRISLRITTPSRSDTSEPRAAT